MAKTSPKSQIRQFNCSSKVSFSWWWLLGSYLLPFVAQRNIGFGHAEKPPRAWCKWIASRKLYGTVCIFMVVLIDGSRDAARCVIHQRYWNPTERLTISGRRARYRTGLGPLYTWIWSLLRRTCPRLGGKFKQDRFLTCYGDWSLGIYTFGCTTPIPPSDEHNYANPLLQLSKQTWVDCAFSIHSRSALAQAQVTVVMPSVDAATTFRQICGGGNFVSVASGIDVSIAWQGYDT